MKMDVKIKVSSLEVPKEFCVGKKFCNRHEDHKCLPAFLYVLLGTFNTSALDNVKEPPGIFINSKMYKL